MHSTKLNTFQIMAQDCQGRTNMNKIELVHVGKNLAGKQGILMNAELTKNHI